MSTITNFKGVVAGSETRGLAHGSDGSKFSFDTDMRFMRGRYIGLDGRLRDGAFGFIWIDLYDTDAVGDPTHQHHDWEHGIASSGLFWTLPISPSAVHFNTATGEARFHARNVRVKDYHDFFNAVQGGGPKPVPSHVSFDVRWHGHGHHRKIRDNTFRFEGHYVTGPTTISFEASRDGSDVIYRSDPAGQYNPPPKQGGAGAPAVGHEQNGIFFY